MAFIQGTTTTGKGDSQADRDLLSAAQKAQIQQATNAWYEAQARGDQAGMNAAHAAAEAVRAQAGYSGGADGSKYIPVKDSDGGGGGARVRSAPAAPAAPVVSARAPRADTSAMRAQLGQWQESAKAQSAQAVDAAVQRAEVNLQRALEDAQPQFREQAESAARAELQALDNAALYAELRGDKGGIGLSQYNEIQAAGARNRLAVQQAQTKLATDTIRQIEDLRAQGEFDKADAALQISQQYLTKLTELERWAAEYNMSAAQFEAEVQQWQANYELSMKKLAADYELSAQKTAAQLAASQLSAAQTAAKLQNQSALDYAQLTGLLPDGTLTLSARNQLVSMGKALLNAGIMPSAAQLAAMGLTEAQASQFIMAVQLKNAK